MYVSHHDILILVDIFCRSIQECIKECVGDKNYYPVIERELYPIDHKRVWGSYHFLFGLST